MVELPQIKVLQITWTGGTGGISILLSDLVKFVGVGASPVEMQICYVALKGAVAEEIAATGARIHCLNARSGYDIIRIIRLYALIRGGQFDIVHVHCFTPLVRLVVWLARPRKFIQTEHGGIKGEMYSKRWRVIKTIHRLFRSCPDLYTVVSHDSKSDLITHGLAAKTKVIVIPNGVHAEKFKHDAAIRKTCRQEWNINEKDIVIGTVRSLTSKMGIDHLMYAAQEVTRDHGSAKFVIVGDGPLKDSLVKMVSDLKLNKNVVFLGERRDIPNILSGLDIFVMPSVWETFGIAAAEAMAASLPVVAYGVGGIREIIVDNETGILVPMRDPFLLATAINYMIDNPHLRKRFGESGRIRIMTHFDVSVTGESYLGLYRNLALNEKIANG